MSVSQVIFNKEKVVATQDSNRALPGFNWALSLESLVAYFGADMTAALV